MAHVQFWTKTTAQKIEEKVEIELRSVVESDTQILFKWRNDPDNYRHYLNAHPVEFDQHQSWLKKFLVPNRERYFLMAFNQENAVGFVRFEYQKDLAFYVSIGLDSFFKGQGLGTKILKQGEEWLEKEITGSLKLIAEIKKENLPSLRMFEKRGFKKIQEDAQNIKMEKIVK